MAGKVLILRWGGSAYDSLGGLLQLIGRELASIGLQPETFVVDEPDWIKRLVALLSQGGFAFALTMSGVGSDITDEGGRLLWATAKVPLFNWNCDHPCYFPSRHAIRSRFVIHGYVFPDHARYNVRHLNPNGAAFTAHLGMPPRNTFAAAVLPAANRNGRIIFAKSGCDTNPIERRWKTNAPVIRDTLFEASEALFYRSTADFLPILQQIAERHGMLLAGSGQLTLGLIRELDAYIRFKRGNLLANALTRYPIDVYGSGWDHIRKDDSAARFFGAAKLDDMLRLLPNYVGCLSLNPLVEESTHDRVFFALAAGVAPCSDSNAFSRKHMPALEPYSFGLSRDRIEQAVDTLLSSPQEALDRTEATFQAMSTDFTMHRAAHQIVQFTALHTSNLRFPV